MPELDLGPAVLPVTVGTEVAKRTAITLPWSSFHYNSKQWRIPFLEKKEHSEFRTWIYGFTVRDSCYLRHTRVLCSLVDSGKTRRLTSSTSS
jgi:hypothetical protein